MIASSLFRRLTDRPVNCQKCGEPLGYVTIRAPKKWEHVECPRYAPVQVAKR